MEIGTMIALLVALAAILVAAFLYVRLKRVQHLKDRFGADEYDRAVLKAGNSRRGERMLEAREKRVEGYRVRPLTKSERLRVMAEWRSVQEHFVDDPQKSIIEADSILNRALSSSGYPVKDLNLEQKAEDLSVGHPDATEHYRKAHEIAASAQPSTENLRVAMQHFRQVVEDLVDSKSLEFEETR